jgi:hypothetical protein
MFMLLVKFQSGLPHEEVLRVMHERLPQFRAVPGLVQKYYARESSTGDYVGIYLFDSEESLVRYRESELAASIPGTYQVEGTPRRELSELLFALRPDAQVDAARAAAEPPHRVASGS